jgi:hypothetical protein
MNNNKYIAALKKALGDMDTRSRNDIIREIKSHAAESGTPLIEHFGLPEELAKQYLDGEINAKPVAKKILNIGKRLFTWIGIAVVVLIATIALFIGYMSGDDFNYSDESASELTSSDTQWVSQDWDAPLNISLDQAFSVFYWHDAKEIRWSCVGDSRPVINDDSTITIRHAKCLIYLPKNALTMNADQAQLVLVRPQVSVDISIAQTNLRVAENGVQYRYVINAARSKLVGLESHQNAEHTLGIKANESIVSQYEKE